jgi:hypothetical protein
MKIGYISLAGGLFAAIQKKRLAHFCTLASLAAVTVFATLTSFSAHAADTENRSSGHGAALGRSPQAKHYC